jgi:hypothetical protein
MFQKTKSAKRAKKREIDTLQTDAKTLDQAPCAQNSDDKSERYSDHDLAVFQEKILHIHLP